MSKQVVVLFFALAGCPVIATPAMATTVHLAFDRSVVQASYAAERLADALRDSRYTIADGDRAADFRITLTINRTGLKSEAYATEANRHEIVVAGGDERGLIYGALSVAEKLRNGVKLNRIRAERGAPALAFRAIKFNLPWDSYRSSPALDLHYETVRDVKFWAAFLDMMADNRWNALTLWNLHPFPYMIRAKNFPEASRFSDAELADWRRLYQAIFRMAKERGIDTYVVNWNILVSPEFARAHNLRGDSFWPNYKGQGDTSELVKRYTRESVTQVLEEYPDLTGLGFSLGEHMGGMTPAERQEWIEDTFVAGMKNAHRPSKMIFRAPFSADQGQAGSTDAATEKLTREGIERLGDSVQTPIWMEIKFNWSHGHSTPKLVKTHGGRLNDTYFTPPPKNYKVAWMVRNEDFFALRWGVPSFIRDHIARNAKQDYVGGYFVGSEGYIPAKDYFTPAALRGSWRFAFERQWLFYKLWGRLLYDPKTPDSVFEAEFVRRYGPTAKPLLEAYSLASATQLRFATNTDFTWDFTIYGEGMMVLGAKGMQPISVDRLIQQRPLLPSWLSVSAFVAARNAGQILPSHAVTPLSLADRLEADCTHALRLVRAIDTSRDTALMYEVADVKTWALLGQYYADKLRGAVALQTYRIAGGEGNKSAAIRHLVNALAHWDQVVAVTRPIYNDMPLTANNPFDKVERGRLFHWSMLRAQIADEVEVARAAKFHP